MTSATDSPFLDGDGSSAPDSDFSLRPLRIQKRSEKMDPSGVPEKIEKPQVARHKSVSSDGFVCRPMRLGSSTTPSKNTEARENDQATQTTKLEPFSPLSSRASTETPATALSRHPSIQIKNLPIVQSPRRVLKSETVDDEIFAVCLVDFHHVRGPEVQWWKSNYHAELEPGNRLFKNLPFQALPDGSHLFEETFSNFNLVYDFATRQSLDDSDDIENFKGNPNHLETLFGCSCVRQVKTADLSEAELERNKDITRSIVQKAVVVLARHQPVFTKIKEKLSIITHSFFQQDSFGNLELLESLFENLNDEFRIRKEEPNDDPEKQLEPELYEEQEEYFVNLNLRELLSQFRHEILTIVKALLLEKRVLVYSNNNLELLTQFQNNMIALVPNLINHLELSGCPLCDYTEKHSPLEKPTTLKTNDRMSMLRFFGLPLQVFNTKGSFWNPYLPLPQMDELRANSFMVGCSNLLIVNQSQHFSVDLLVDLDAQSVTYPSGKTEDLRLTALDRKFVSVLLAPNATREAYVGSDDYIRYQFEDYIRSLVSTVRYHQYVERFKQAPPGFDTTDKRLGSVRSFNPDFVARWQLTKNYQIWHATCDEFIFNFHSPSHIAAEMSEPTALGGFLQSFKKAPPNLTDRANQYFSHAQQPRKYIASESEDAKEDQKEGAKVATDAKEPAKSAWWFKK